MPARTKSDDMLEATVQWYGPITYERVRDGEFTQGMLLDGYGVYYWGAEKRDGSIEPLYVGQSVDITARQSAHLISKTGEHLERIRKAGVQPLFWCGHIYCSEYCGRISEANAKKIMTLVEKSIIFTTGTKWNAAYRTITLDRPVRVVNAGRVPDGVRKTIRLIDGLHA